MNRPTPLTSVSRGRQGCRGKESRAGVTANAVMELVLAGYAGLSHHHAACGRERIWHLLADIGGRRTG